MKQKIISTKNIWVILLLLLTGSLYAQTYMGPWKTWKHIKQEVFSGVGKPEKDALE